MKLFQANTKYRREECESSTTFDTCISISIFLLPYFVKKTWNYSVNIPRLLFEVVVTPSPLSSSAAMDMADSGMSVRHRLGKKVSLPVVSSTTDDGEIPRVKTGRLYN